MARKPATGVHARCACQVSDDNRVTFLECRGKGAPLYSPQPLQANLRALHGLASCAESTGVKLSVLLEETGIDPKAKWFIAEMPPRRTWPAAYL
jgi:hypothetical protein